MEACVYMYSVTYLLTLSYGLLDMEAYPNPLSVEAMVLVFVVMRMD
jgi:hypothetical protein